MAPDSDAQAVRAISRAVAILSAFTPTNTTIGVVELSRIAGLSRSTTHRLLCSMASHGLIRQVAKGGDYSLGPTILKLASVADKSMDIRWLAHDLLEALRDRSGETAALHIFRPPRYRLTLAQAESLQPLRRSYTDIGELIPVHQGASGQVLLAHQPGHVVDAVLEGPLEATNEHTIVDPAAIRSRLDLVADRGYALSVQGRVLGIASVAVPVFNHVARVTAALSISGPMARVTEERLVEMVPLVRSIALELSERLGYQA